MSVVEAVRGRAREGAARTAIWALRRRGDLGAQLLDRRVRVDPYPHYRRLREEGPLVPSRLGLISSSHAAVERALRDPHFGHANEPPPSGPIQLAIQPPRDPSLVDAVGPESMIGMDPPEHTRLRGLVSKVFTPRAIAKLRPRLVELANGLLDAAPRDGHLELMSEFAGVLPVLAICEVLGVPSTDRAWFRALGNDMAPSLDLTLDARTHARARVALRALQEYFTELFAERRANPGDDLLSGLVAVSEAGERLSQRELLATSTLLLVAGFETTVNLIGNGTLALLRHPEQLDKVAREPERIPNLVEEVLRYDSPVQLTRRMAVADTELEGQPVPAGSSVLLCLGGANRDPAVFAEPDRFDVTRPNARRHLSFAAGPHHCLGASLARLEAEVAFGVLLERYPDLRLASEPRRRRTLILRGMQSLPLQTTSRDPA